MCIAKTRSWGVERVSGQTGHRRDMAGDVRVKLPCAVAVGLGQRCVRARVVRFVGEPRRLPGFRRRGGRDELEAGRIVGEAVQDGARLGLLVWARRVLAVEGHRHVSAVVERVEPAARSTES